jgi:KDO2-lipid IV(A) lauroyltransferase
VKRGYYESHFEVLTENPRDFETGALIQLANDRVAADIYKEPYLWLWTHKRWKHKDKKPKEQ